MARRPVIVVGAGVSGLSCACELLDAGLGVEIWTRDLPAATTSAVAAALWHPFMAAGLHVGRWAERSRQRFATLAQDPKTGVQIRDAIERTDHGPRAFAAPVVEMPVYLAWMHATVLARGAVLHHREIDSLDAALDAGAMVVNTTGLGAGPLTGDRRLFPVAGQVVRIKGTACSTVFVDEREGPSYIVPRSHDTILGGTTIPHEANPRADLAVRTRILQRCAELAPVLQHVEVLEDLVGVRPCRDQVRLEKEGRVVHDYGHGGAGVTLSWGCAEDVRRIVVNEMACLREANTL